MRAHCLTAKRRWPRFSLGALGLVGALTCGPLSAQAASEGALLADKYRCSTCHGLRGKTNASRYPNLAGQKAAYIDARLRYFRAREEAGNQMNAQAAPLTDELIAKLAAYYASLSR